MASQEDERLILVSLELPICVLVGTKKEIEAVKFDGITDGYDGIDVVDGRNGT